MPFYKGHTYCVGEKHPMFGKHHTEETKKKMSKAHQGKTLTEAHKKAISGHIPWNKGLTKETDERVKINTEKTMITMRKNNLYGLKKGMKDPKGAEAKRGNKNPNWQGGKTPYNRKYHGTERWRTWREKVYKRDNYTCQDCKQRGGKLHPHHIIPISKDPSPKNVFNIDNGQTLCVGCHREKHKGKRE